MARTSAPRVRETQPSGSWGWPAFIGVAVFVSFLPVLSNDFVNWDDPFYFAQNPHYRGLSPSHLQWMFTTTYMSHYQPISWLTHAVVYEFWGMDPRGYHFVNLLFHVGNGVLLYTLIIAVLRQAWAGSERINPRRLTVAAAVGALFFAVHPLRVEAVAWATERQEVVCGLFFLLSLLAYVRMCAAERAAQPRRLWYALSVGCFALSLMSKAAGLTLPVLLLVADNCPLRRLATPEGSVRGSVLLEKLPYLVLTIAALAMASFAKGRYDVVPLAEHGLFARSIQAGYGLSFYLWKTLVPLNLSPLYALPHPLDPARPVYVLGALATIGITISATLGRRRYPAILAAWVAYIVIVSPFLGLVQSGPQIAADRYTYLASLPWSVLVAAVFYRSARIWKSRPSAWPVRPAATAALGATFVVLAVLTTAQTRIWRDSLTLWTHVLSVEPDNDFAYFNRGHARHVAGNIPSALVDYDQSIRLDPTRSRYYNNRGSARAATGDFDGALADFDEAIRRTPEFASPYGNRGNLRHAKGDVDGALADYNEAIRLAPTYADAYANRAKLRQARGDLADAVADYSIALQLTSPGSPQRAKLESNLLAARRLLAAGSQ